MSKIDKNSIDNDLYKAAVISIFPIRYLSIQKFDLEDTGKLVTIVAASEMTREYLIKQKIIPEHINI